MRIAILSILILSACAKSAPATHCYLTSAFYLITGDYAYAVERTKAVQNDWPASGSIIEAFEFYNTSDRAVFVEKPADIDKADANLINNQLVVVIYKSDGPSGFHAAPYYGQPMSDIGDYFKTAQIDSLVVSYAL